MYSPRKKLIAPGDYNFPYEPYYIQQQLMDALYSVLENKEIGVFESPTGTGKSLTLTCAALKWLEDHEALVRSDLLSRIAEAEAEMKRLSLDAAQATDWITAQYKVTKERDELRDLRSLYELLQKHEQTLKELRESALQERKGRTQRNNNVRKSAADDALLGNDAEWDEDKNKSIDDEDLEDQDSEEQPYRDVQIFFCSRTHSQLAQVVGEVKRSAYGKRVRCISLASRQQVCIHPQLRNLGNSAQLNERCLDMARRSSAKSKATASAAGCPYKSAPNLKILRDVSLVDVLDIEDLVGEGERSNACPYYANRSAIPLAQLIMLPYQMLLHKRTRMQSGIDLRGAIVIIDEAHNLLDTISQLHSCELSKIQLQICQQQILTYKMRYAKRFSTANLFSINQLLFIVKSLWKLLASFEDDKAQTRVLRTYELTAEGDFFNIDIYALLKFCERTRFAQKLQALAQHTNCQLYDGENLAPSVNSTSGMLMKLQQQHQRSLSKEKKVLADHNGANVNASGSSTTHRLAIPSSIRPLLAFLESLTDNAEDGRVLIIPKSDSRCAMFKYILLNPSGHFEEIVREARAIIVAGGTMQPTSELTEQLFKVCPERVKLHFYDHVVPVDSVQSFALTKGPHGGKLCFNYSQRQSKEMLIELGMVLTNLSVIVPGGLICFFPSYEYLDLVYATLESTDFLQRIERRKTLFVENRATGVEQLLAVYTATIRSKRGALLLSVVGGKLSEGLNFADDLGRGVVVVGLPYPNRNLPEIRERMAYMDATLRQGAGNEYYENLCMKAVNQCIGRSVRHIRDYACVYLLDERYATDRIQSKLPQWIVRNMLRTVNFGVVQGATAKFFKQKKQLPIVKQQ